MAACKALRSCTGQLERVVVAGELLVEQPHFQHVVDAGLDLDQIEGLADEILRPGLQGAQLVTGLGGQHDHRQIVVGLVGLEGFHHLEAVHDGHLQIEQDQVVAVVAVQRTDLQRVLAGAHGGVAGLAEQTLEQFHVGILIVDDQDPGAEDFAGVDQHVFSSLSGGAAALCANSIAVSSVSMNSLILMGLVR